MLLDHLQSPSCRVYTGKRLVSYSQGPPRVTGARTYPGSIRLNFSDGTVAPCDLLVGADGIKSTVRACMLNHIAHTLRTQGKTTAAEEVFAYVAPKWSGTYAYRTTIPAAILRAKFPGHRVLNTPHIVSILSDVARFHTKFHHRSTWPRSVIAVFAPRIVPLELSARCMRWHDCLLYSIWERIQ